MYIPGPFASDKVVPVPCRFVCSRCGGDARFYAAAAANPWVFCRDCRWAGPADRYFGGKDPVDELGVYSPVSGSDYAKLLRLIRTRFHAVVSDTEPVSRLAPFFAKVRNEFAIKTFGLPGYCGGVYRIGKEFKFQQRQCPSKDGAPTLWCQFLFTDRMFYEDWPELFILPPYDAVRFWTIYYMQDQPDIPPVTGVSMFKELIQRHRPLGKPHKNNMSRRILINLPSTTKVYFAIPRSWRGQDVEQDIARLASVFYAKMTYYEPKDLGSADFLSELRQNAFKPYPSRYTPSSDPSSFCLQPMNPFDYNGRRMMFLGDGTCIEERGNCWVDADTGAVLTNFVVHLKERVSSSCFIVCLKTSTGKSTIFRILWSNLFYPTTLIRRIMRLCMGMGHIPAVSCSLTTLITIIASWSKPVWPDRQRTSENSSPNT